MATYSRTLLSGSTSGLPIVVVATVSPGSLIHTAVTEEDSFDELYIWASNVTGETATLTLEWGGLDDPTHLMVKAFSVPAHSPPIPIATGQVLNGALLCRAFSSDASAINITGYVNRIA